MIYFRIITSLPLIVILLILRIILNASAAVLAYFGRKANGSLCGILDWINR